MTTTNIPKILPTTTSKNFYVSSITKENYFLQFIFIFHNKSLCFYYFQISLPNNKRILANKLSFPLKSSGFPMRKISGRIKVN